MDNLFFIRQLKLFGEKFQIDLSKYKVSIIGLGGLGSWLSEFLVRLGVKEIILVDYDDVSIVNLHRQIYYIDEIGKKKIDVIENRLKKINEDIKIEKYEKFDENSGYEIFKKSDILFDCVDDIKTKYIINEFSVLFNKNYIFGSVAGNVGYVGLINPNDFCFYDIFHGKENCYSCNNIGINPSLVYLSSSLMLNLFIDYVKGNNKGRLFYINMEKFRIEELKVKKKDCEICVKRNFKYIKWR